MWIVDSGATFHITNGAPRRGEQRYPLSKPIPIQTANGTTHITHGVTRKVPGLGQRRCLVMPDSPNLLSLGELVETEGFYFVWDTWYGPQLWDPRGRRVPLEVTNMVPTIARRQAAPAQYYDEFFQHLTEFFQYVATRGSACPTSAAEIPLEHYWTHMPQRSDCEGCLRGKMRKSPAYKTHRSDDKTMAFLDKIHIDIIGPVPEDVDGNAYIFVARDEATDFPYAKPIKNRGADTTRDCLLDFLAGQREFPKAIACDNDKSFQGSFRDLCKERQCDIQYTIPYRSTSNARAERFNRTVNEGIRSFLAAANAPYELWGYAAQHFEKHYAWTYSGKDGSTPHHKRFGKEHEMTLYPWACEAFYHDRDAIKFGDHGRKGVILGYHRSGAMVIMDWEEFTTFGTVSTTISKDFKAFPRRFPFKDMESPGDASGEATLFPDIFGEADDAEDGDKEISEEDGDEQGNEQGDDDDKDTTEEGGDEQGGDDDTGKDGMNTMGEKDDEEDEGRHPRRSKRVRQAPMTIEDEIPHVKNLRREWYTAKEDMRPEDAESSEKETDDDEYEPESSSDDSNDRRRKSGKSADKAQKKRRREKHPRKRSHDRGHEQANVKKRTRCAAARMQEDKQMRDDIAIVEAALGEIFGTVARPIRLNSPEGRSDKMKAAIQKEKDNLVGKGVWKYDNVDEYDNVRRTVQGAEFVRANLILVEKNAEDSNPENRKFKARIVALGDQVRDAFGRLAAEEELYGCPISMQISRIIDIFAGACFGEIQTADVEGAYLQAELKGAPKYLELPRELWPAEWAGKYSRPVVPLEKALYGLQRSGFDWQDHAAEKLMTQGWQRYQDVHRNLFQKDFDGEKVLIGLYVDDVKAAGTATALTKAWKCIQKCFKLGEEPEPANKFTGIWHGIEKLDENKTRITTNQVEYAREVVSRYKAELGRTTLKEADTPGSRHIEKDDSDELDDPGDFAGSCRKHIGGLLFLARGTRPDILYHVSWLGRFVTMWTKRHDKILHRLMCYLEHHGDMGIESTIDKRDFYYNGNLTLEIFTDADHGGCPETSRSTSGGYVMLVGKNGTRCPIDWCTKRQGAVARSTGEAETVAVSDVMTKIGITSIMAIQAIFGQEVWSRTHIDNSAAISAIRDGYGKMRYMLKTQRISISWLRDLFANDDLSTEKVSTQENPADLLTKTLDKIKHWYFATMMGLVKVKPKVNTSGGAAASNVVHRIAFTGAPHAGKTTIIPKMREELEKQGFAVEIVTETATEMIRENPELFARNTKEAQKQLIQVQMQKEDEAAERICRSNDSRGCVILYDRCVLDGRLFCGDECWQEVLQSADATENALSARYDGIVHLETTAKKGHYEYGPGSNNDSRITRPCTARKIHDKSVEFFGGIDHTKFVEHEDTLEKKVENTWKAIQEIILAKTDTGKTQ